MSVVYIAGPITGVKDYWRPFSEARWDLARRSVRVLDPTTLPEGMTAGQYMRVCLAMVDDADAVLLLPGWEKSNGATIEAMYARYIGKPVCKDIAELERTLSLT